jgi:predicted nucleic acid-binding protein
LLDASVLLAAADVEDVHHLASRRLLVASDLPLTSLDLARYEIANVANVAWKRPELGVRLLGVLETIGDDGGLIASDMALIVAAGETASANDISVYDASYVVAARRSGHTLVSCDERDLISKGLAVSPTTAFS